MTRKLVRFALMALGSQLLWAWRRQAQRNQGQNQTPRKRIKAPAEQTWESEGGALRSTGAQMGPDPVLGATQTH